MDQAYIMEDVKEKCCYVSSVFKADMELSRYVPNKMPGPHVPSRCRSPPRVERPRNPIIFQYLLPDFSLNRPGRLLEPGQVVKDASWQILEMNNERFTVPELLFTPSDIGTFLASSKE